MSEEYYSKYFRKIIHICAEDSPNVRYALAQKALGLEPDNTIVCQGVLTWEEYVYRRKTWDKIRQCIGLDGRFYEDSQTLMFPPTWLNRAERLHLFLRNRQRIARGMGIDPAEGGDRTAISVVDEYGLIELWSERTPNTQVIITKVLEFIRKYSIDPKRVIFDRGGGGKQLADQIRAKGYAVKTVSFGDSPSIDPRHGKSKVSDKLDIKERRYTYVNRRAELYGELRILLDPMADDRDYDNEEAWKEIAEERKRNSNEIKGFAFNPAYTRLREQLSPIPLLYDNEQRLKMLPKNKKDNNDISKQLTLTQLIGYSPDEADSLVLAIHAMQQANKITTIGAI